MAWKKMQWVLPVILYNLACETVLCNTWHWLTYAGPYAQGKVKDHKLNKNNQYLTPEEAAQFKKVGMFSSSNGNLQREIFFTTLGVCQLARGRSVGERAVWVCWLGPPEPLSLSLVQAANSGGSLPAWE